MTTETQLSQPMNTSRPIEVLYKIESGLNEPLARVANLLAAPARIGSLLKPNQRRLGGDPFKSLWKDLTRVAASLHIERSMTDWVFEKFWDNQYEPKHSK